MNVDIFQSDPDVKYYFASAVPLMAVVLVGWYIVKHALAKRRQTVRHFSGLSLPVHDPFSRRKKWCKKKVTFSALYILNMALSVYSGADSENY